MLYYIYKPTDMIFDPKCVAHQHIYLCFRYQEHKMSKEVLLEEIAYVNDMIKALSPHPTIAHGDFHLYNVLYDEHKGKYSNNTSQKRVIYYPYCIILTD